MSSLPIGLLSMTAIVVVSLIRTSHPGVMFNLSSILLVIGGSLAVLFTSNSNLALKNLFSSLRLFWKKEDAISTTNRMLMELAQDRTTQRKNTHPLVAAAQEMWESGVEDEFFANTLSWRLKELNSLSYQPVAILRNLAKYPPALGMMGTVMGMIGLFTSLGINQKNALGGNLATTLTATFYGLLLANAVLMPLADRMGGMQMRVGNLNEHIYKSLLLIHRREPQSVLKAELDAYAA